MPRRLVALARPLVRSRVLRQSLLLFSSTMLVNVLGYAFHFAASRKIGVENYGELTALLSLVVMTSVPAGILTTVSTKYAAEFRATGDYAHLRRLVHSIVRYIGFGAGVLLVVGLLCERFVAAYLRTDHTLAVSLAFVLLALNTLLPVLRGVLQGLEDFRAFAISIGLEGAGKAILGVAFVFAGFGTAGAIAGWILGLGISLAYTLRSLLLRYREVPDEPFFIDVRRLALTLANVTLATLVVTSLGNIDLILVKHYFRAHDAGIYGAVSLSGKILLFSVGFIPMIVLPRASHDASQGTSPIGILVQGSALLLLLAGGGLAIFALVPGFVITSLAGHDFAAGASLVFPYGLAMVLLALLASVVSYKTGIHRFDFVPPLVAVGIAEVVAIVLRHDTVLAVVQIVVCANGLALVLSLLRINAPVAVRTAAVRRAADDVTARRAAV